MPLFFTIILIEILAGMEVDLFIPSFPELQKTFNLTPFLVQLTLSVNFVAYCICSLLVGTLGDRFNRRHVMLGSLGVFVLGSLFCVLASSFYLLLLGRFFQGVGMAGPAVLAYVLVADEYPIEKQPAIMGIYNGICNISVAIAPIIGSYVSLYFNWRGNFILLLVLGLLAFMLGYRVIPNRKNDTNISLSLKSYIPLLTSPQLMYYVIGICFLAVPYWVFTGMAPILYMEDMGVPLKHFGLYQGAIAGAFSIVCILSSKILNRYGKENCLNISKWLCGISAFVFLYIALANIKHPLVITCAMVVFAIVSVFPFNIYYPYSLEVIPNSKARTAALIHAIRLLLTAFSIQSVSYIYNGIFFPIGITIFVCITIALYSFRTVSLEPEGKVGEA